MAPKEPTGGFYAVKAGHKPGVYSNWVDCELQVKGFPQAKYKKFSTAEEAKAFVKGKEYSNATSSTASSSNIKKRPIATAVENEDMYDIVYTDGASKDNGKPSAVAGVGVWWGRGDPRNIAERCPGDQTNNRAELIAILRVLEETPVTKKPLLIRTDSRYCMQCLEDWMPNWIRNNWMNSSKEPVKNAGIIRLISAHLDLRGQRGQQIRFDHVKGHSGDVGNDGADYQANQGTLLPPVPDRDWATAEVEVRSRIRMTDIPVSRTISRIEEADGEKSVVIESSPIETPAKRQRVESPQPSIPEQVAKTPAKQSMSKAQSSVKTPLRTPSRDANRLAAIEAALSTPIASSSRTDPTKKSTRVAEIEASLVTPERTSAVPRYLAEGSSSPTRRNMGSSLSSQRDVLGAASLPTSLWLNTDNSDSDLKPPLRVLYVAPALIPPKHADPEPINLDDYADCLLSDEDLSKDLLD